MIYQKNRIFQKKNSSLKSKKNLSVLIAIILSLVQTNSDNPGQRNKGWRIKYAQKTFLRYLYFG